MVDLGDMAGPQCCCGRFKHLAEPYILNNTMHEPLGPPEAFCGPIAHHDVRDLRAQLTASQAEVERLTYARDFEEAGWLNCFDALYKAESSLATLRAEKERLLAKLLDYMPADEVAALSKETE